MKPDIHPKYYRQVKVTCACGNEWETGSTQETLRTDVCSKCHPFFTGQQRIVDTTGHVDRFQQRVEQAKRLRIEAEERKVTRAQRARERQLLEIVDEDEEVSPITEILGLEGDEESEDEG